MNNIYYLSHGGPGSGRYPLGSGNRPYQKFEGSRRTSRGIISYIKNKKAEKSRIETQKRIIEEEKEAKRLEENKERVLRSGTASEVMQYKGKIPNNELQEAVNRLRLENQLSSYAEQEVKSALDNLKKLQTYTNVGSSLAKDGIELYNSLASIYNATERGREKPLTLIRKGDSGGDKKDKK